MLTFTEYLIESLDVDKLKHLEHLEDHIIHGGDEGVAHAADNLDDMHNFLQGKRVKSKVTTKYDGSPSIVFGINPENNKNSVGNNYNITINYNKDDIKANHGHSPGLQKTLELALEHLPKIMPKDGGVYQGDFMYDRENGVTSTDTHHKFTPNTITYSAKKNSTTGRKIDTSKIGFVVHTKYKGKHLSDMKAGFDVDHSKFNQDPDVHLINPEVDNKKLKYSPELKTAFENNYESAKQIYASMAPETIHELANHQDLMKQYINNTVKNNVKANAKGYIDFLKKKKEEEMGKVKTAAAKEVKAKKYDELINYHVNSKELDKAFKLHTHLQNAKTALVHALGNPTDFEHHVNGKEVKPEGFVATREGRPTKFVDRSEFSRLNFAYNRGQDEETTPLGDDNETHVMAFGRMNPPTVGHGLLVDKVKELAKAHKAKHSIILSHSNDPEKNPLTPEQKLMHAKRFFPGTNIQMASAEHPTFIHHAKLLHKQGVKNLIMVAGSDRVPEYHNLLHKYNGKDYNFKNIHVVSAGERDADSDDVSGMSASKMRNHAITRNFAEFKKGIPSHVHPEHARELYDHVRQGMDIQIDQNTKGHALARHALRQDEIGARARREQERRKNAKK